MQKLAVTNTPHLEHTKSAAGFAPGLAPHPVQNLAALFILFPQLPHERDELAGGATEEDVDEFTMGECLIPMASNVFTQIHVETKEIAF